MNFQVTPDLVLVVVMAALSLFFDYFPGVSKAFDGLAVESKRLITVGLAILVGIASFLGQCFGYFSTNLVCDVTGGWELFYGIVLAVAVMYGFHKATKPSKE